MIYLDNSATTALDPQVLKAMLQDLEGVPYNPSSYHQLGRKAYAMLSSARERIASHLKVLPEEIIFTSSASEAINLAMRSLVTKNSHLITSDLEHSAVYNTALDLEKNQTAEVTFLSPQQAGAVQAEELEKAIRPNTSLIVLSAVNGETGTFSNLEELARIAEEHKIPFLVDGVALLGKKSFSIPKGVSAMAFSGHKIHGPKGIGFLIFKKEIPFKPLITGGPQEHMKRAGTENLSGILGLAKALELSFENLDEKVAKMNRLRNLFEQELLQKTNTKANLSNLKESEKQKLSSNKANQDQLCRIQINSGKERVCNVSNLCFEGIEAEELLILLDQKGIAASHGSACSSKSLVVSRVLSNMYDRKRAKSSVRFSLSHLTTEVEIKKAVAIIATAYQKLTI